MNVKRTHDDEEVIATKAWDSAVLRRLMAYARPHGRKFLTSFGVLVTLFALQLAQPTILRAGIDGPIRGALEAREALAPTSATLGADGADAFDATPFLRELFNWGLAYVAVILLAGVMRYFEVAQLSRTGQAVIHDLRMHVFGRIHAQDVAWFDRTPTGALVTRVTTDIENLNELFTSGLIVLLFDLIKIVVVLALLFWVSVPMALLVLVLTPLLIAVSLIFRGGARRAHRAVRARLARMNGYLQEVLSGIRVVQVFRREERVSGRFAGHLASYLEANYRTIFLFGVFYPTITLVAIGIQGGALWRGGNSILTGQLTAGQFVQFWFWLHYLLRPIRELGERYNVLQSAFASAERIFDVVDSAETVRPPAEPRELPTPLRGEVRFENVSFAYETGPTVVEDVSFEIPAGKTVALVGATGSGKSTLVSLLLRFHDPASGCVRVDGVDLRELDLGALRGRLGLVLQEDYMFSGSVRDNLELGRPCVSEESLARALEASSASELIDRLPRGLDTPVAERGATLSTGERELVAIARALAANPALVVFDEATSSVDSATEARIEAATHRLLEDRSALVVAHRLSTVRRAHQILVMHHGRVRERGTHAELLAHGGIYARLYAMQFRDPDVETAAG